MSDLLKNIEVLKKDMPDLLKQTGHEIVISATGSIGSKMSKGFAKIGGRLGKNETKILRVATGRLFKSFQIGKPDTETDISISDNDLQVTIGTNVQYARIHEYGGRINLGARSARSGGVNISGAFYMPARPYFNPGMADFQKKGLPVIMNKLRKQMEKKIGR